MPNVTLSVEDYTTLAGWSESYGVAQDLYMSIREMTERIERANGLTRQYLMVRWRDGNALHPSGFGSDWPPQYTQSLVRYTDPWTYDDVMAVVNAQTSKPVTVQVTTDRTGTVGWYDIAAFFG